MQTYLDERSRLRRCHPRKHSVEQFRKDRQDVLACPPQQMYDQVAHHETARLVLALKLLRDNLKHTVQARAVGRGVRPRLQLWVILANDSSQRRDTVLQQSLVTLHINEKEEHHLDNIPVLDRAQC